MRENEGNEKRKCDWQTFCCFNVYRGKKIFISSNIFGSINFDVADVYGRVLKKRYS